MVYGGFNYIHILFLLSCPLSKCYTHRRNKIWNFIFVCWGYEDFSILTAMSYLTATGPGQVTTSHGEDTAREF